MIVLSNTTDQVVQPGQAITFNTVVLHTGNGECHRPGTSSVKMKANGIYELFFSGNIGSAVADTTAFLAITVGGEVLAETRMISETSTANELNNVAAKTAVKNCCCDYDRVTVVNTGINPVNIGSNPTLFIKRVS